MSPNRSKFKPVARGEIPSAVGWGLPLGLVVNRDGVLPADPFDQFVELDGLLGSGEAVGERKSVLTGCLRRFSGGSG